jgi:hypothetical protein
MVEKKREGDEAKGGIGRDAESGVTERGGLLFRCGEKNRGARERKRLRRREKDEPKVNPRLAFRVLDAPANSGSVLPSPSLPGGVMVAQATLTRLVMVRIHAGQPV